jgi:hypothetical protein
VATAAALACGTMHNQALAAEQPVAGGSLRIAFFRDNTTLVSLDPFQV